MATRRAGVREVATYGRQHPDAGDAVHARTRRRAHRRQLRSAAEEDWSILDGLNYVKDHVDGSLVSLVVPDGHLRQLRDERRGRAAADVCHLPHRLRTWAGSSRAADQLPVVRDLVVDIDDFMEKLPRVKPWIIRDDDVTVIDGEYLQTPEELEEYKQFSNCINCMLCYAACPIYGLEPDFIGPAAIALAERYDLDSRDRGQRERLDVLIEKEGVWGCTFVGECTRVCPKHVDPAGAIQRYKLKAATENLRAFLLPGVPMSAPVTYRQPVSRLWWLKKRTYFLFVMRELSSVFVAWFAVFLMMMVFAIGRGEESYQRFLDWAASPVIVVINVVALALAAAHGDVVRAHSAGHGSGPRWPAGAGDEGGSRRWPVVPAATVVRVGGRLPAAVVIASQYAGLIVVSAFITWLVLR